MNLAVLSSSSIESMSVVATSSMGLNLTGSSLTMDQAVLTIWMTRANYWDMMSLSKDCLISGGTVAHLFCCLHKFVLGIHQLLPQVGSHHEHVHP